MADVGLFDKKLSMNEKHGKRGQWISLFYLTLSDISAAMWTSKTVTRSALISPSNWHSTDGVYSQL
jgi:hypothetical protein